MRGRPGRLLPGGRHAFGRSLHPLHRGDHIPLLRQIRRKAGDRNVHQHGKLDRRNLVRRGRRMARHLAPRRTRQRPLHRHRRQERGGLHPFRDGQCGHRRQIRQIVHRAPALQRRGVPAGYGRQQHDRLGARGGFHHRTDYQCRLESRSAGRCRSMDHRRRSDRKHAGPHRPPERRGRALRTSAVLRPRNRAGGFSGHRQHQAVRSGARPLQRYAADRCGTDGQTHRRHRPHHGELLGGSHRRQ